MNATGDPVHVLHVDDDPEFAEMAAAFLEREDDRFTVTTATSAADGLDVLSTGGVDCIVSDYEMPGRTGIEFLEAVREDHPDLPFVLFTGRGSEEVASEAISADVSDYLQKTGGTEQYAVLANRVANLVGKYRAERARERHRVLVEEATDAILVVAGDATIRYATPSAEPILGRTPTELVGTSGFAPVHPEDRDRVEAAFGALLDRPGSNRSVEFRYERPDGSWIWVEARGRNIAEHSVVDGIVVYARDVTERKEREMELERRTRAMDRAPVGITMSDPERADNPLVYANDRFEELTGYDEAEVVGRNCRFLQGDGTDPDRVAEMREAIAAGEPVQVDLRNYRKDGTEFWNRVTIAPVRTDDGELISFVGFQEDVTDRKAQERALERERDRFQAVFEESFDPMVIADDDGRYVEVNDRATELFGLSEDELLGRAIGEFAPEEYDAEAAWAAFRASDAERGTFPLVRADGTERTVEYAATTDVAPGEHLSILRDITERRRREAELERRNERLDAFASLVSHDLQNPLGVAEGRLEFAREECDSEHLDAVAWAHERMRELIEDMLTLAREGKRVTDLEPVALAALVDECWENVVTAEATPVVETDRTVLADRSRLQQLLENLIRNAVEHGGADVTVTVGDLDGGFYVADDGRGIPEDECERVLDAGCSRSRDGHGFGLAIVAEIAEAHGWTVGLTESADGGARFEITGVAEATR